LNHPRARQPPPNRTTHTLHIWPRASLDCHSAYWVGPHRSAADVGRSLAGHSCRQQPVSNLGEFEASSHSSRRPSHLSELSWICRRGVCPTSECTLTSAWRGLGTRFDLWASARSRLRETALRADVRTTSHRRGRTAPYEQNLNRRLRVVKSSHFQNSFWLRVLESSRYSPWAGLELAYQVWKRTQLATGDFAPEMTFSSFGLRN
jgi:hypothetical protein